MKEQRTEILHPLVPPPLLFQPPYAVASVLARVFAKYPLLQSSSPVGTVDLVALGTVFPCVTKHAFATFLHGHRRMFSTPVPGMGHGHSMTHGTKLRFVTGATCRRTLFSNIHPVCPYPVSYTHLRAHETKANLVCRLLLEKKKQKNKNKKYITKKKKRKRKTRKKERWKK